MKTKLVILLLLLFISLFGETLEFQLQFELPQLSREGEFTRLEYEDCQNVGKSGNPELPQKGVQLLLPPGNVAINAEVTNISYYANSPELKIYPIQMSVPLSRAEDFVFTPPGDIYLEDGVFPTTPLSQVITQFKNGHPISLFTVCPVKYYPAKDSVVFIKSITVKLFLEKSQTALQNYKHDSKIAEQIKSIVANPQNINLYDDTSCRSDNIDILVVTNAALSPAFDDYLHFKETCGYSTALITTEDIYANYPGADAQEQIRNAIIDYYQEYGLQFVILGGDSSPVDPERNIVPHRGFYGEVANFEDFDIPADMYYCCLDGCWNDDNDEYWGEYYEGDFFQEISVGRIAGATIAEISAHLHKLFLYQCAPVAADLEKCLLVGQQLGEIIYGGEYLDELASGSDNWGYSTEGISDNFYITRLYRMYEDWEDEDLFECFNAGTNLVNNMGHGNTSYCFDLNTDQLLPENITNDGIVHGFFNCYSQACYSGAFDNRTTIMGEYIQESFAEKMTTMETAAASFVANSRYGWFAGATTNGISQHYAREFYDAIFGDEIVIIGLANAKGKEDNAAYMQVSETNRWTYYNLNLLGEPSMNLWTQLPEYIPISFPAQVHVGDLEINYDCEIDDLQFAFFLDDELVGCGNSGDDPIDVMCLNEPLSHSGFLHAYVNKANFWQYYFQIEVLPVDQELLIVDFMLDDSQSWLPNGLPDYGEDISISASLLNAGMQDANNIELIITCSDSCISITNSSYAVTSLNAGDQLALDNVFAFTLAENIPDAHEVLVNLQIFLNAQLIREYQYNFTAQAPIMQIQDMNVFDHNNGVLDPAETVVFEVPIKNIGHSVTSPATCSFLCDNSQISIADNCQNAGQIEPQQTVTLSFDVTANEALTAGELVEFTMISEAGGYYFIDNIPYYTGVVIENFETADFSLFPWFFIYLPGWLISNQAYEGDYCACTPPMNNMSQARMEITVNTVQDGYIRFWIKTSMDENYDGIFEFFLNHGDDQFSITGTHDWFQVDIFTPAGDNEFSWVFFTHNACDARVWLDHVVFPPMAVITGIENSIITNIPPVNFPNPFNPETTITYYLTQVEEEVTINIYNIKGQKVYSTTKYTQSPGENKFIWNSNSAPTGIYFYQINTSNKAQKGKMLLIK